MILTVNCCPDHARSPFVPVTTQCVSNVYRWLLSQLLQHGYSGHPVTREIGRYHEYWIADVRTGMPLDRRHLELTWWLHRADVLARWSA